MILDKIAAAFPEFDARTIGLKPEAIYVYELAPGQFLFRVIKFRLRNGEKIFVQQRRDGDAWTMGLEGIDIRPLFRLPALERADMSIPVLVPEGEKDVLRAEAAKPAEGLPTEAFVAVCSSQGAGSLALTNLGPLLGRDLAILVDHDEAGYNLAIAMAKALRGKARSFRTVEFTDLPLKGDLSDWLDLPGNTMADLLSRIAAMEPWTEGDWDTRLRLLSEKAIELRVRKELEALGFGHSASDLVLDPAAPYTTAKKYVAQHWTTDGTPVLHFLRDAYLRYDTTHYVEVQAKTVRKWLYEYLDKAVKPSGKKNSPGLVPFKPTMSNVSQILDALQAYTLLENIETLPEWIDGREGLRPVDLVPMLNGILHVPTRELIEHTPLFLNTYVVPFNYDPEAPEPVEWMKFLRSIWPDDPQAIETLQEIFGYLLTPDTSFQKIFMLIGPKRGGRGTISRVLEQLVGPANFIGQSLDMLGSDFGMENMIGKQVASIGDARVSGRMDKQKIAAKLLGISGEDKMQIPRKHRTDWNGKLPTRIILNSNVVPSIPDSSGALVWRFIKLKMTISFFGREDLQLGEKLSQELSGIFNWALEGLPRLKERGYFIEPDSSISLTEDMQDSAGPLNRFLREACVIGAEYEVETAVLREIYQNWCRSNGVDRPLNPVWFGRQLRYSGNGIELKQPRDGESRLASYTGLQPSPEALAAHKVRVARDATLMTHPDGHDGALADEIWD